MKYGLNFRIWHWLNAVVVLALLGTVFLRKTFLSWRTNSEILMSKLAEFDVVITAKQSVVLAKAVRAGMWEWHILLGYALAFLVVYRVIIYFTANPVHKKFSELTLHKKAVRASYYVVYATLIFMSVSGLVIHFYQDLGLAKDFAHDIKELHELVYNVFLFFVPLHIAGVLIAENRDEEGLLSTMVNGKQRD